MKDKKQAKPTKPTKRKKLTPEEHDKQQLEFSLQRLRESYIPELNENSIRYKVGDRVSIGAIKGSIITEVLDSGKIYKVHQIVTENNYGNPFDWERDSYVEWVSILPYRTLEELKNCEIFSEDVDFRVSFSNRDIRSLLHMAYFFGVDLNADYQRGSVWELEDKVALITSIFKNIEIGKFAVIHLPFKENSPSYEMLDGKQRLLALMDFYEGKFRYNGRLYWELNPRDQNKFVGHCITIGECREEITQKQKYDYFLRLNTGGKPQDPAHLKKVEEMLKKA